MKIDALHALEDLVRIYDSSAKMVFREATDNALDISATEIDIKTGKDGNGKYWISFDDNGRKCQVKLTTIRMIISTSCQ